MLYNFVETVNTVDIVILSGSHCHALFCFLWLYNGEISIVFVIFCGAVIFLVGNIPYEATEEQLKEIFCQAGPVVSFR